MPATIFFPTFFFGPPFLAAFTTASNGETAEAVTSSNDEIHVSATRPAQATWSGRSGKTPPLRKSRASRGSSARTATRPRQSPRPPGGALLLARPKDARDTKTFSPGGRGLRASERPDSVRYVPSTSEAEARLNEESQIPRRYVKIRGKRATAEVWASIPGRENEEIWLKAIRPVVKLAGEEDKDVYGLIGRVHAALSEIGLRRRAQRFVTRAYYAGSYDEARRIAKEFVEFE